MARVSIYKVKNNIDSLLTLARKTNALELAAQLKEITDNVTGPIYYSEVDDYTEGDSSIKSIETVYLPSGTVIMVLISNFIRFYQLIEGESAGVGKYQIVPDDYNPESNEKYWQFADVFFMTFTNANLDESHSITVSHGSGIKYMNVIVADADGYLYTNVPNIELSAGQVKVQFVDEGGLKLTFAGTITGTHTVVLRM